MNTPALITNDSLERETHSETHVQLATDDTGDILNYPHRTTTTTTTTNSTIINTDLRDWPWLTKTLLRPVSALRFFSTSFSFIRYAHCLRLVRIEVPVEIKQGQLAALRCLYDPENNKLQSLAWYKNGREFYRYQPYDRRPILVFNRTGVHVDVS